MNKSGTSREVAISEMVDKYMHVHNCQQLILSKRDDALLIRYEDLMADDEGVLIEAATKIFGEVDYPVMRDAMQDASPEKVNEFEKKTSMPIVAGQKTFTGSNFIRSGKVGEYRDFFTVDEISLIDNELKERNYEPL